MRKKTLLNKTSIILLLLLCGFTVAFIINSQKNNKLPKEDRVYLADYKNINIPEDILSVSEEDISSSIDIRFSALQPSLPKEINSDLVEYGDLITIKIMGPDIEENEITTTVEENDEEYNIGLQLLGFHKGDTVKVDLDKNDYRVTIIEIKEEVHELTDDNVSLFFDYNTIDELREFVRQDIVEHRVFEYCYSVLLTGSRIQDNTKENSERDQFIKKMIIYNDYSGAYNADSTSTVDSETGYEHSQLVDDLNSFFDEYVILRELINCENISISEDEFDRYCDVYLAQGYDKTDLHETLCEYVLYDIYYDHTYEILLKYNLPQERSV